MKLFIGLVLCLASLVAGVPAPAPDTAEAAVANADPLSYYHAFNIAIPETTDGVDTIEARGYDPSTEWQKHAMVEVWTGGAKRQPMNWGNIRGSELSDLIFNILDKSCPWDPKTSYTCMNDKPTPFMTKTLIPGTYPFNTGRYEAMIITTSATYVTRGIRTVMARIIADTLAAYTKNDKDYNCYEFADEVYCNVPFQVRVNLPFRSADDSPEYTAMANHWHVITNSAGTGSLPSPFGYLRPCKTRREVDAVMDKYKDDIVKEFPRYGKDFSRDARVIINGYKVCSDEP